MSWRRYTDWAKRRPATLKVADFLGRGSGRLRFLDHLSNPPKPLFRPDMTRWTEHELAALWIGHATVLLRVGGLTILTDPVLSNRVGLGLGIATGGPRRLIAPALTHPQLPKIDLLLISHAHFDHLDRPTLARLGKRTPIITASKTSDLLLDLGFTSVTELRWGDSTIFKGLRLTAREANHWGARTFFDQHRGFNSYLLEAGPRRVLYGGDTAYHEHFKGMTSVDLAIFGIGAYNPYEAAHATPEQAWAMAQHCEAKRVLAMHHSTFKLSHEPMDEPIRRMLAAAGEDASRIVASEVGQLWAAD